MRIFRVITDTPTVIDVALVANPVTAGTAYATVIRRSHPSFTFSDPSLDTDTTCGFARG